MLEKLDIVKVCGLAIELTNSQTENNQIIQKHWINFNNVLKLNNLTQKSNWVKYGITFKVEEKYFYLSAIPFVENGDKLIPFEIPQSDYYKFTHQGNLALLKQTFWSIYKEKIPSLGITIDSNFYNGFIHFERYDYRFKWNDPNSLIDIYLPVKQ